MLKTQRHKDTKAQRRAIKEPFNRAPLCLCVFVSLCFLSVITITLLAQPSATTIQFTDVTKSAGITFTHYTGAFGKKYLPETLGPGVAFIDYDGDGWQDLFFTNGKDWPGQPHRTSTLHLFRNNQNGTFTDVTRAAGLAIEAYALGVAVGNYANDGDEDLFVTTVGQNHLFRNTKGVFTDVTKEAGLAGPNEFSTSAAWVDVDRDGNLDLVVGNYVQWTPQTDLFCTLDGTNKSYCTPESYKGAGSPLAEPRKRHIRGCDIQSGSAGQHIQNAGVGRFGCEQRPLARSDSRQRYSAQPALHQ